MEFEFDKEIDSLLHQTAKSDILFPKQNANAEHIDVDEISMFAENALPEKARPRVMKHLANCDSCRTNLSNLIVLNAEAKEATAAVPVQEATAETVVASTEPNWFQKLFATKNLAFGMGALALIFAVGIGFIVVQNLSSGGGELAKETASDSMTTANKQSEGEDFSSDSMPKDADSNVASSEDGLTNGESKEGLVLSNTAKDSDDKTSLDNPSAKKESVGSDKKILTDEEMSQDEPLRQPPVIDRKDKPKENDVLGATEMVDAQKGERERNRVNSENERSVTVSRDAKPRASSPTRPAKPINKRSGRTKNKKLDEAEKSADDEDKSSEARKLSQRSIKGKTFTNKNNVWTDSDYKGQRTTNVKRGTTQYRNLDAGLQSIGNQLSGTVLVVWKSKAYKIQ